MPTCPICGTEVRGGTGFCPKCLRWLMTGKAAEGKSKKKLVGIIVACVIAIIAVVVIATNLPKVPPGGVAEVDCVAVSAYDFAKDLFDPQLTTLQRDDLWEGYEGKLVEWTNELKYVSPEKGGLVAYFLNPSDWGRIEVKAAFDDSQRSSLLTLKEGDLVTYTGALTSFGEAEIALTNCTVVSLRIGPLWWNDDVDTGSKRILVGDEVLCLGPGTYDDAAGRHPPAITAINRETGKLLWEGEKTESVLVAIDSRYVYAWHSIRSVPLSGPDYPRYWYEYDIAALDKVSGQIDWRSSFSEDIDCVSQYDCLPGEWSESDFVSCCVLGQSVKEEITDNGGPGLTFLIDKPPLSELTYEHQGVTYNIACAVYGGVAARCGALRALDRQTGELLWMMTFKEKGVNDFSIVDGILYVSTDEGVGAFKL